MLKNKQSIFCLVLWATLFCPRVFAEPLGYCPTTTVAECKASLEKAVEKITNCDSGDSPDTKQCALIFVETLSDADNQAPFFEGFYEKVLNWAILIAIAKQ